MEMKLFKLKLVCLIVSVLSMAGCESNIALHSGAKLNQQIQGEWEVEVRPISDKQGPENWVFANSAFYVIRHDTSVPDTLWSGDYAIDASISKSFVNLSNVKPTVNNTELETKWLIIKLNNEILNIVRDYSGGGHSTYEFIKKQ